MKQRSREGLAEARGEQEEREQLHKELQDVHVWLEAADGVLSEMEQSSSTQELEVGRHASLLVYLLFKIFLVDQSDRLQICPTQT